MKEVYVVMCNVDTTEGRGPVVPKAIFTRHVDAKKAADKLEPYGHSGQFNQVTAFVVYDAFHEFEEATDENIKKKALAKLTDVEKKVLGLK